ncbi:ribonuclease III [Ructibacterium gallinarum]|uniref:ribonuclease III n=1 Tax=Ructibacterium gallinarum TaxID=2779355 RepID=UPI001CF8606D|nr:ribonuclease III [Ructibacterium gallinarum]
MNIGYTFRDQSLLKKALTHISLANECGIESNQRLEFLGDSILSFVVAEHIYHEFKNMDEGRLTEMRAAAVCEKSLAAAAREMDLGSGVRFGKSETVCGGKNKASILADTFEAVLGAIYLDGGMEPARAWILEHLGEIIEHSSKMDFRNYKSEIQTYFQKRDKGTDVVTYRMTGRKGPDHKPEFSVEAVYRGKVIGKGTGGSRKAAEQQAARQALEAL